MMRILPGVLVLLVIAGACTDLAESERPTTSPSGDTTSTPAGSRSGDEATPAPNLDGDNSHSGQNALRHVEMLAGTIGTRVSGTEGERRAVEYIREELESYGYAVEVQEFSFQDPGRFANIVLADGDIQGVTLEGSKPGTASGVAVEVGLADGPDLLGVELEGRIAVADRGVLTFRQKYENVRAAGAVGLVIINNEDGIFAGNLGLDAAIPVVGIAGAEGDIIRAAVGAVVEIRATAVSGVNVVARPAEDSVCTVIVGGHHDSVPGTPGAHDNASGTANVLELARAFAVYGIPEGLCFVTFGAEESGLYGSRELVARLEAAGQLPEYMVNLDVTGIGNSVEVIGALDVQQIALAIAEDLNIDAVPSLVPDGSSSDHASFQRAGVPVVFLTTGNWEVIHTPRDVVGNIDAGALDLAGDLAYGVISELLARVAAS